MVKLLRKLSFFIPVFAILIAFGNSYKSFAKGYEDIAPQIIKALLVNLRFSTDVRFGAVTSNHKLGTISISNLILRTEIGKISFDDITFSGPTNPQSNDMFIDGQIEISDFHYEINSRHLPFEFVAMSREVGFEKFTGDAVIQFAYQLGNSTLDYTLNFNLNGGGDLTVNSSISDIHMGSSLFDFWNYGPEALVGGESLKATLKSFTASFVDKGFLSKAVRFYSKKTDKKPSQILREIPPLLSKQVKHEARKLPSKAKIYRFIDKGEVEVQKFLLNPKNFTLSILPESPVRFEEVGNFIKGGNFELLNLQFRANQQFVSISIEKFKYAKGVDAIKLALMHLKGIGTPQNFSKAERLLQNTKSIKNPEALFLLSQIYFDGSGVKKDFNRAYELGLLAGARGYVSAPSLLTKIEEKLDPREIKRLQNQATKKWEKLKEASFFKTNKVSAMTGDLPSVRALARAYLRGSKLPRNYKLAYVWSSLGAAAGDPISRSIRDRILSISGKSGVLETRDIISAQDLAEDHWKQQIRNNSKK